MSFLPSLPVLAAFSLAGALLALTPGPDMALFLSRTLGGGRRLGFAALFGAASGLIVHALLASLGLSVVLAASPSAFTALKIAGAAYLLYLAFQMLRHGSALNVGPGERDTAFSAWATGLGINLLNPKVILFYVTFLPQFVDAADPHAGGKMLFLGLFQLSIGIPISALIILAAERVVGTLKARPGLMRVIDYCFAGLMGAFAARLLLAQRG